MAAILKIGNIIEVPIRLEINDAGKPAVFAFKLTAKRLTVAEWNEHFGPNQHNGKTVREFLLDQITGWQGQGLVVDDQTNQPAPFSPDHLDVMLGVLGVQDVIFAAYLKEVLKASTPDAKAKN